MKLYAFNKPVGVEAAEGEVSAVPQGAEAVDGVLPTEKVYLYPVNVIEKDARGLVIMTDDKSCAEELGKKLAAEEMEWHVDCDHPFKTPVIQKIRADHPCKISWTEAPAFVIQIKPCSEDILRDICKAEGYEVTLLKRYRVGKLKIKKVAIGTVEEYTDAEVEAALA